VAAGPAGAFGELLGGGGVRLHGHQVGAGVAERLELAVVGVPPDLGAEPARVQADGVEARADEDVRDRVAPDDLQRRVEVAVVEEADGLAGAEQRQLAVTTGGPEGAPAAVSSSAMRIAS
jgi:hypothetical protein